MKTLSNAEATRVVGGAVDGTTPIADYSLIPCPAGSSYPTGSLGTSTPSNAY